MTKIKVNKYFKGLYMILGFIILLIATACTMEHNEPDTSSSLQISPNNAGLTVPEGFGVIKEVSYIRNSFGNSAELITTNEVAAFRSNITK